MADTALAVTAVVVSGVVGPGLGAWWSRSRQRADHREELTCELRVVLDEAAQALGQTKRAFERVYVLYNQGCARAEPTAEEAFIAWRRTLADALYAEDRIAIRVGVDSEIHKAFVDCIQGLKARRAFAWAYERGEPMDEAMAEERLAHAAYPGLRKRYIEACRTLVGPSPR
jgi:hypothetical protein